MPSYELPSYDIKTPRHIPPKSYFDEKILIGLHMEAPNSSDKAPPATPKATMKRLRFTALLSSALGIVVVVLALLLVIAGKNPGQFEDDYLIKLNTTHVGENIINFERASATTTASPTATTTRATNPLDPLGIFATNSPLNPFNPSNPLSGPLNNLTDSINEELGDTVNSMVKQLVDQAGVRDFYYVYVNHVCMGSVTSGTDGNSDGVKITKCATWDQTRIDLKASIPQIQSSVTIANTRVSIPILGTVSSGGNSIVDVIAIFFKVALAFLIIVIICAALVALISLAAIIFPNSRLLIYPNLFFSVIAQTFSLMAAIIVTVVAIAVSFLSGEITGGLGVFIIKGSSMLVFVWIIWACTVVLSAYWGAIWFVQARTSSFVKRKRSSEEIGNWGGIFGEVNRDLKGEKQL